jgi:hypothetical protein
VNDGQAMRFSREQALGKRRITRQSPVEYTKPSVGLRYASPHSFKGTSKDSCFQDWAIEKPISYTSKKSKNTGF